MNVISPETRMIRLGYDEETMIGNFNNFSGKNHVNCGILLNFEPKIM